MIAPGKAVRPRSLSTGSLTASHSRPRILEGASFAHRTFSWGAKSKWGSPHAGKVYKGFYTRQADAQIRRSRKYPSLAELDRNYIGTNRLKPHQGWRSATSWRKSEPPSSNVSDRSDAKEGQDWYGRWERQKMKQYNEFVRRIEQDPYQALFGASNKWLGWLDATQTSSKSPELPQAHSDTKASSTRPESSMRNVNPTTTSSNISEVQSPRTDGLSSMPREELDYEIDPITLRKVPKKSSNSDSDNQSSPKNDQKTIHIPVKTCSKPSTITSLRLEAISYRRPKDWLSQEGFCAKNAQIDTSGGQNPQSKDVRADASNIESALDRHIKTKDLAIQSQTSAGDHEPKEKMNHDVDLLAASDIRASAGSTSRFVKEDATVDQSPQKIPEERYEQRSSELEEQLAKELASSKTKTLSDDKIVSSSTNVLSDSEKFSSTDIPFKPLSAQRGSNLTSSHVGRIRAKLIPLKTKIDVLKEDYARLRKQLLDEKRRIEEASTKKAVRKARDILDQEIRVQQAAMYAIENSQTKDPEQCKPAAPVAHEELHGEGDMASNVHEFAGRARWYKRKAPHAQCEMDAKLQRVANEKAFVREIRGIYEDTYGPIDTEHRPSMTTQTNLGLENSSNVNSANPQLLNMFTQDWGERLEHSAKEVLPIEKEIAHELRSLAFIMEDCRQRASGETDQQRKDLIMKEAIDAASECGTKLMSAGLRIALSHGPLDARALRQSLTAASKLAGVDFSDLDPSTSTLKAAVTQSLRDSPAAELPSDLSTLSHYRILAYDGSSQKVSSAKTSSQTPFVGEDPLSPLQALNRLQNPGKFLPHLVSLHNKGYDIVSGANDILILKKVREAIISKDDYSGRPNPIDGTTTPEVLTGNFASPTGFVNHNPVLPPEEDEPQQSASRRSTDKVRREEDVFSGTTRSNWQDSKRNSKKDRRKVRRRKTFKRMLLTGTLTAAACYATGVVFEMMHI